MDVMFAPRVSLRIYGLGAVAMGLVGLAWGDFALVWQPVANGVPKASIVGYATAFFILLAGLAMQWQRVAGLGALALAVFYSLGAIIHDIPSCIAHPGVF